MKKYILMITLVFATNALADIDAGAINVPPNATRVTTARACFDELQKLGCGHPKDDQEHFRKCMSETYSTLSSDCQKVMKRLYGK